MSQLAPHAELPSPTPAWPRWIDRVEARFNPRPSDTPPGPPRGAMPWQLRSFMQDQVNFMSKLRAMYGPLVQFGAIGERFWLVSDPALIDEVWVKQADAMLKDRTTHSLRRILGMGLLTSEGELWRRQRKLAAPALKRKQIDAYVPQMIAAATRWADQLAPREERDAQHDMMGVTLDIVVQALFGTTLEDEVGAIGAAMETLLMDFYRRENTAWRFLPEWMPDPHAAAFDLASERLDATIYGLIAQRRRDQRDDPSGALLGRLQDARDEQGQPMSEGQLRDELMTFFMAGHETTALTLTYALSALGHDQALQEAASQELSEAMAGGRALDQVDVLSLPLLRSILLETLRLYPPAWMTGRQSEREVQLGPWRAPAQTQFLISAWVMHRDPRWFEAPESFQPERWQDGLERRLPRHVFMPFGGGPRVCIGNHFALMESALVLAVALLKLRWQAVTPPPTHFTPAVTLRPTHPVRVTFQPR